MKTGRDRSSPTVLVRVRLPLSAMSGPLTLVASTVDPHGCYVVRAHVEAPDGRLLFASRQSCPVLTGGFPNDVDVDVV